MSKPALKLTRWFPGTVSPVRPGVYERRAPWGSQVFSEWNGAHWLSYCRDANEASLAMGVSAYQDFPWRGVLGPDAPNPPTYDELARCLRALKEAVDLLAQPMRLDGLVSERSPGGQLTAHLPDGTPVCRHKHRNKVMAKVNALLDRMPKEQL